MEEIILDVTIREQSGTRAVKEIRRADMVPAIVYGGEDKPSMIKVDRRAYERIMRFHRGQSVLFHLNVSENEKKVKDYSVIVKEEQHDPVSDKLIHIDFNSVSLTQELEVSVPIVVRGEAVGVKQDGGAMEQVIWELDVICLPTNIPEKIEVDVSELNIGDAVHVKELNLPVNIKTKHNVDDVVITIAHPQKEEPETPSEDEDAEPEVISEKKETAQAQEEKTEA